ncbi:FG-GAP repeat domain-containing protein [Tenacibaculum sediminilitoris]
MFLNDGKGNFEKMITYGNQSDQTRSVDIGDFDQDGFPDIVESNSGT